MTALPPNTAAANLTPLEEELADTQFRLSTQEEALRRALNEKGALVLAELEAARLRAHQAAMASRTDPLTGLLRHGDFRERLRFEMERAHRLGTPLGLLLADVDAFAQFNEARGYARGEWVLTRIGSSLKTPWLTRPAPRPPVLAREGGDCFGVLLPGASHDEIRERAEEVRELVEGIFLADEAVTVSVGATGLLQDDRTPRALIERAQRALQHCVRSGGNRVAFEDGHER